MTHHPTDSSDSILDMVNVVPHMQNITYLQINTSLFHIQDFDFLVDLKHLKAVKIVSADMGRLQTFFEQKGDDLEGLTLAVKGEGFSGPTQLEYSALMDLLICVPNLKILELNMRKNFHVVMDLPPDEYVPAELEFPFLEYLLVATDSLLELNYFRFLLNQPELKVFHFDCNGDGYDYFRSLDAGIEKPLKVNDDDIEGLSDYIYDCAARLSLETFIIENTSDQCNFMNLFPNLKKIYVKRFNRDRVRGFVSILYFHIFDELISEKYDFWKLPVNRITDNYRYEKYILG